MASERLRRLRPLFNAGLVAISLSSFSNPNRLQELRADFDRCTQVYNVGDRSVVSHSHICPDNSFHRAAAYRKFSMDPSTLLPKVVTIPSEINGGEDDEHFSMYHQIGPTCYLTCIAAAMSDLSEKQDGPAIEPLYLSDFLALRSAYILPEPADTLEAVNATRSELANLGTVDFGHGLQFKIEPSLWEEVKPSIQTPGQLYAAIAGLSREDTRLIYSSKVDEGLYHAVLVLDHGIDEETGIPFIFVAEPNGGGMEHSPNAPLTQGIWTTIPVDEGFLMRIDLTQETVGLTTGLTRISLMNQGEN